MSGWSTSQVNEFAKRLAYRERACWPAYVDDVREALIDSEVLSVVLGQDSHRSGGILVEEIKRLRNGIGVRLASKHGMPNVINDQVGAEGVK